MLKTGNGFICTISANGRIVASGIFLNFNNKAYFKFGASDRTSHQMRPNDLMMWKSMLYCKKNGCSSLNLGRTEMHHAGLLRFKKGFNSLESPINYFRLAVASKKYMTANGGLTNSIFPAIFSKIPLFLLRQIGKTFYRFAG